LEHLRGTSKKSRVTFSRRSPRVFGSRSKDVMVDGTSSATSSFDAQKAEAFASRLLTALNDGALCLMAQRALRA
jgi:hypothetical protein